MPHTILIEAATGRQFTAAQLPGISIPNGDAYRSPYDISPKDYPRITVSDGDKYATWARAMAVCGIILCPIFSIVGLVLGIIAHQKGSVKARGAIITCIGSLVIIAILGLLLKSAMGDFGL